MAVPPYPTVTIDSTSFNTWVDLTDADAFLLGEPEYATAWDGLSDDEKGRAIVGATRSHDRLTWQGAKTATANEYEMPRTGLTDRNGTAEASDEIPTPVVHSVILQAAEIGTKNAAAGNSESADVRSIRDGSVTVQWGATPSAEKSPTGLAKRNLELIRYYLEAPTVIAPHAPGTDEETTLDITEYERSEGFA